MTQNIQRNTIESARGFHLMPETTQASRPRITGTYRHPAPQAVHPLRYVQECYAADYGLTITAAAAQLRIRIETEKAQQEIERQNWQTGRDIAKANRRYRRQGK